MVERAGFWRRGVAAATDLILAQMALQALVALLFAASGGHLTTGITFYSSCRPAQAAPAGVTVPSGFAVTSQSLCTSRFFAPTRAVYVAWHEEKAGAVTTTTTFAAPTSPDGSTAMRVLGLDALFYPLFVLLRWASDRFAGGSPGRRLARIAVADLGGTAEGMAFARLLARRYARFAWIYVPGALVVLVGAVVEAGSGTASPTLAALAWVAQNALVGAAQLTAAMAIWRHADTFYDAPCGTVVATRLEIARARDMAPDAASPTGPGPLLDLANALWLARQRLPWVTLALAGVMIVVFAGEVLFPWAPATPAGLSVETLMAWGGVDRELAILLGQPYRLLAAIFLHASAAHLVVNLAALLVAGFLIERGIGPLLFGAVFLLGGLAGSLASVTFNPPEMISVGASGAILALFAAALPLGTALPRGNQRRWLWAWALTVCIPAVTPGVTLPGLFVVDRADHAGGEVGGLLLGIIVGLAWRNGLALRPSRKAGLAAAAGLAGLVGITVLVGGLRAPTQSARLVPAGEAPADDAGWERQASQLLARYPDDPRVRYGLALQEAGSGLAAQATADLDAAITGQRKLSPVHAGDFRFSAHAGLGANFFDAGDLDDAIAQFTAALDERPRAELYRQRGISELYRGRGAEAVSDLRQALTIDPKEAYAILWLSIAAERTGLADPIAATAQEADLQKWPGQLVRYFDTKASIDRVRAAAGLLDLASDQHRVCETQFYEAEMRIMHREFDAARPLFERTLATCPKTFIEYRAALEELAGHGGLPPG
ncbi:rhomboid family intramembrane serine protease [Lichenibacterium minor]|uniref:Rhomboid family intramembrane serine protease n=1 Tax=Lichenibacterium minor TaxID=2316528 RepID=A0A4Q2U9J7_9HYPH|nr:rhomboid family intramembrane serine protease [Lichenibacterium minor]RYC33499.1 rhomboid family intramembrane serine protease [Lichenibacterium minor]